MKHPVLTVEKRTIFGKKLKSLRREGTLPGNVYGEGIKSTAVQLPYTDFLALYKEVKNTGMVDLQLDGKTLPVLIHRVDRDHLRDTYLHADFFKVNLKEKIKATIPLVVNGESPAVNDRIGVLMQAISEIEVEALPEALPENIEISIEGLTELGSQITVADLKTPEGATILNDPGQVIVKIDEFPKEVEEEPAESESTEDAAGETETDTSETGETSKSEDKTPQE